jgi:thiamine biosynthesis protein ThiI
MTSTAPLIHHDKAGTIVLRVSEIFLKGQNRRVFVKQFTKNARRLLDGTDAELETLYLRFLVHYPAGKGQIVLDRLSRLFGLHSMSPATLVERDVESIAAEALIQAKALPPGTFKVKTKRRDKRFPTPSMEVSMEVGGQIHTKLGLEVDVHNPDHTIHVEIGDERSFVYTQTIKGPGGLPVATAGRVGLLLSGGIDSPVAGHAALRRGCLLSAIYFHSFPYTGDKTKEKVLDLAKVLAGYQRDLRVHVVHFTDAQKTLREHGPGELAVLLYRRMMMRVACKIAEANHLQALATGENLGQVASQTLENLRVIEDASSLPILRPLITYDKSDIIDVARSIGTYDTSILPYDDCCTLFVPKHPATKARIKDLERAEKGLDLDAMAQEMADAAEQIVVTG